MFRKNKYFRIFLIYFLAEVNLGQYFLQIILYNYKLINYANYIQIVNNIAIS